MTIPVVRFVFGGQEAHAAGSGRPWTVVYDGQCKVCGRLVKLLDRWDTRDEIETIPFQNTTVLDRFPWIPGEAYAQAMQLVGPGGQTWQGGYHRAVAEGPSFAGAGWAFKSPSSGSCSIGLRGLHATAISSGVESMCPPSAAAGLPRQEAA